MQLQEIEKKLGGYATQGEIVAVYLLSQCCRDRHKSHLYFIGQFVCLSKHEEDFFLYYFTGTLFFPPVLQGQLNV